MPTPIKRSKELTPLSRDHHDGLLLCWKIRMGIKKNIGYERIAAYIKHVSAILDRHFIEEERYVFNLLDDRDPMKTEALQQHKNIRELIARLDASEDPMLLIQIANVLDMHIRFEERQLFGYIEDIIPDDKLQEAGAAIEAHRPHNLDASWKDEYWLTKKTILS